MSTHDEAFTQTLGPSEWPVANFDAPMTPAEWDALDELEARGAFDAWSNGGTAW